MESEAAEETCIIVVQVQGVRIGIVVDRVSEVSDIASSDIEDTPSFGADVQTDYLLGIGKSQDRVRLLLDIERVLSTQEIVDLRGVPAKAEEAAE
jgi:purine-binding chemotaxis protein CheW